MVVSSLQLVTGIVVGVTTLCAIFARKEDPYFFGSIMNFWRLWIELGIIWVIMSVFTGFIGAVFPAIFIFPFIPDVIIALGCLIALFDYWRYDAKFTAWCVWKGYKYKFNKTFCYGNIDACKNNPNESGDKKWWHFL